MPKVKATENKAQDVETKEGPIIVKDIQDKIKAHADNLKVLSEEGRKVQDQRNALTQRLSKITEQAAQLVGAIQGLQDLIHEPKPDKT